MVGPRDSHVTILLSTFDGQAWLPELLDSIRDQSHEDWTLLVRDDGSSDGTVALLDDAAAADARIVVTTDDLGNLGPSGSFLALLAQVEHGLFAFCDQDDVWLPHKLDASIEALGDAPIAAVYTDAVVVDADGEELHPSALTQRGAAGPVPYGRLLINNAAIGATVLGTAALARRAVDLAAGVDVLWHDWWVALVAGHDGDLHVLSSPTMRWRRHPDTVTGPRPPSVRGRARRRRRYLRFSIAAAAALARAGAGSNAEAAAAARALGAVGHDAPTPRALIRAWRGGGVRAWSLRGEVWLLFSVALGRTDQ